MFLKNNLLLQILVVIIMLIGAIYFVYTDLTQTTTNVSENGDITHNNTPTTTGDIISDDNGPNPAENIDITPRAPNLNRPIVFNTELPVNVQDIYRKQITDLTDLLKADPSLFNSWVELGVVRKAIGDYEGAREIWEYAGVLAPENNVSFFNLGDLYHYHLKDYVQAEKNFLISRDHNYLYIPVYRALFDLYTLSYKQNTSAAENILLEGLEYNTDNLDLTVLLAGYYKEKGDTENARKYYEKALTEARRLGNESMIKLLEEELRAL